MFVVFYTVNFYICVFMTCSTSCCLYNTYVSMECMYVYEYLFFECVSQFLLIQAPFSFKLFVVPGTSFWPLSVLKASWMHKF